MVADIKYEWINNEKSRYFVIAVKRYKESHIAINHVWGGCYSNRGGKKVVSVQTEQEAQEYINQMMKRRKSRGYELVAPKTS